MSSTNSFAALYEIFPDDQLEEYVAAMNSPSDSRDGMISSLMQTHGNGGVEKPRGHEAQPATAPVAPCSDPAEADAPPAASLGSSISDWKPADAAPAEDSWDDYMENMPTIQAYKFHAAHDQEFEAEEEAQARLAAGLPPYNPTDEGLITAPDHQRIHEQAGRAKQSGVTPSLPAEEPAASAAEDTERLQEPGFNSDKVEPSAVPPFAPTEEPTVAVTEGDEDLPASAKEVAVKPTVVEILPEVVDESLNSADAGSSEVLNVPSNVNEHVATAPAEHDASSDDDNNVSYKPVIVHKKHYRTKAERRRAKIRAAAATAAVVETVNKDDGVAELSELDSSETYTTSRKKIKKDKKNRPYGAQRRKVYKPTYGSSPPVPEESPPAEDFVVGLARRFRCNMFNLPWFVQLAIALAWLSVMGTALYELELI